MEELPIKITGLTEEEVLASREKYGTNEMKSEEKSGWLIALLNTVKEPMFILLLAASIIYFVSGQVSEGIFMVSAIVLVSAISLYQESKSKNALAALRKLSQPKSKIVREGHIMEINSVDVVVNDVLVVEEGSSITADATIIYSNDFTVNESILTGESLSVQKSKADNECAIFMGTSVATGMGIGTVTQIGDSTKLGKIGKSLQEIKEEATPLQVQIGNFVKRMAIAGSIIFVIVWGINYFQSSPHDIVGSLLKALTLAMSILPEEIPVALSTFMALGAWRLMKMGIIVKQTKTVETLGSATVICTDKTGTITENNMQLAVLYDAKTGKQYQHYSASNEAVLDLIETAMFASEPLPFDPMEIALHNAYKEIAVTDERRNFKMVHEYPLGGRPPMMTHIFENKSGNRIIACKGAPEKILDCCKLSGTEKAIIDEQFLHLTEQGYRVLGVAKSNYNNKEFLAQQDDYEFEFIGLVSFYDPPKKNINEVFNKFYEAGIKVKIITGDTKATAQTIARQVGLRDAENAIDGETLMQLSASDLEKTVIETNIFTRMFPEAKLKIINALKSQQQIVAMTGDGVNDGPALKAAHIGIAMGITGSEIAKNASSLILENDDLGKMVDAVAMGRRIYSNLKKAIQYIISIHIPIILMVFLPLVLGWIYPSIFTPVHVIFLELIMGPTCSIIYENEPIEKNLMQQAPRPFTTSFLKWKELNISIFQGLAITAANLAMYQYAVYYGHNENTTRTMVFITLISANIFLTLVNRSFYYSVITTLKYKNNLLAGILLLTLLLMAIILFVPFINHFFKFEIPDVRETIISVSAGFVSVIWIELYKYFKRKRKA
jgi:Ca2+-transporting ATPase